MKLINNGKLFGKINIFDVVICLLVIALVVAGFAKFKIFNKAVDATSSGKVTYTFLIDDVRDYTANAFVSGDVLFDTNTDINIGTITNVELKDAKVMKAIATGKTVFAENPYKKDVILTVESPGSMTKDAYFANKSVELKVGSEKKVETRYVMVTGKIGSIVYSDGK